MNKSTGITALPRDTKMRYQQFPDEETCKALAEMKAYYTEAGTTPTQVFKVLRRRCPTPPALAIVDETLPSASRPTL